MGKIILIYNNNIGGSINDYMKIVLQDGFKDCGVCSLLSIIRYYGGNISKEYLRDLSDTTKDGVSFYNLISAACKLGFKCDALNGEIENIDVNNLPCIAHVIINKSYQHFVALYDINFSSNKVVIMDPAKGKRVMSLSAFKLMSSNNYLFLTPEKKLPIIQDKKIIFSFIKEFVLHRKSYFIFFTLLTSIYFIFNAFTAFHFKYLLDYSISYNVSSNLYLLSIVIFYFYLFKEISLFLRNILLLKYSQLLDNEITSLIYNQIILLPYLYYKNRTSGEVISRIKDLSIVKSFIIDFICFFTTDLFSMFIFIVLLFNINFQLALISIITGILLIVVNIIFRKSKIKGVDKYNFSLENVNSYLIESLSNVDVVKGMHIEKNVFEKFKSKYKTLLKNSYYLNLLEQIIVFIKNNINNFSTVIILFIGSCLVLNQKITLNDLIVYQSLFSFYNNSFINIIHLIENYPNYRICLDRIEELFTISSEKFLNGNYYKDYSLRGNIVYKNLNYSYNSMPLLSNINLVIYHKDKIFLHGSSGSGKSTLIKILMRYIEIPFNKVSINDIDINHYHLDVIRNGITYISQQEFLFNDTIYNNIVLNKNVDDKELKKVIKLTMVDEIIKNDKLDINKLVEENGFNFSGGERQRIILARALLKKSDIYIFDEALSQIDIERERKILINIFKYLKDKTVIVVSHRFDNKDLFSRILELKNGEIADEEL